MALIVEDGTGKSDAESLESVSGADTYFAAYAPSSTWVISATTATKETALRAATQWILVRYAGLWGGRRKKETQALPWPREGVVDEDDFEVASDSVPLRVRRATAELALRHVDDAAALLPDVSTARTVRSKSVRVGDLAQSIEYAGGVAHEKLFQKVEALLRPYVSQSGLLLRG